MAARKAEVVFVGDAKSVVNAARQASGAAASGAKQIEGAHTRMRKSFSGLVGSAAKMAVGVGAAYASIKGAKDAIATTEDLGKATIGLHKNLGLTIEQASRWAAVAKARGIDNKSMNMSFGTLSKNITKNADEFKKLGVSQQALKSGDFNAILGKTADGLAKMGPGAERTALSMKLFGRGWQTIVPVLRNGSKAMDEQLALADKYGVTLHGKTVKSVEELVGAQRESKFASMGLQVALGTSLIPTLTKAVGAVSRFVANVRSGGGGFAKFRADVSVVAAALKQGFAVALDVVKRAFNAALPTIKALIGYVRDNGPAAFARVKSVIEGTVNVVKDIVKGFKDGKVWAVALVGALAGLAVGLAAVKAVSLAITAITKVTKAWAIAQGILNAVMAVNPVVAIGIAIAVVVGALVALELKTHFVEKAWKALKKAFHSVVSWIGGAAAKAFDAVKSAAHKGLLGPVPLIISRWGDVKSFFSKLPGRILGFFKSLPGKMAGIGKDIIHGFIGGIRSMAGDIINAIKETITDKLPGFVKKALGIKSPSRVFKALGSDTMQGYINGLLSKKEMVKDGLNRSLLFPLDAAIAALNEKKDALQKTWDKIDQAAQRSGLVAAIGGARKSVASAQKSVTSAKTSAKNARLSSGAEGGAGLEWAKSMVGHFRESTGFNTGPELDSLEREFGMRAQAWCAMFATKAIIEAGAPASLKTASVATLNAKLPKTRKPRPGDLMTFGNAHVGVVESVRGGVVHTIEGNTSAGAVARRTHGMSEGTFLRVPYPNGKAGGSRSSGGTVAQAAQKVKGAKAAVSDAVKALREFDKAAERAKKLAKIDVQVANLERLKAFKDAVKGIRDQVKDLASQAASVWREGQEKAIGAVHDAQVAAINGSADAQELAALQAQDRAEQDAKSLAQLQKDIADAEWLVAHSGGKVHQEALQQLKDAEDAMAAYRRQKREEELQANLDAARQKADDDEQVATGALEQQTADYQAGLEAQMGVLVAQLEQRKLTYAAWAKDVNAILSSYGLSVATDSGTESAVKAGAGSAGKAKKAKPKATFGFQGFNAWGGHRASGGWVYPGMSYRVGEVGPETFTPRTAGRITSASQSGGGGGGVNINYNGPVTIGSQRAAEVLAHRLAHRVRYA